MKRFDIVTHYFGHLNDPLTTCVHVPKRAYLHEKVTGFLFQKTLLRKGRRRLHHKQGAMMPGRRTLP
jgi:hypothetical protein